MPRRYYSSTAARTTLSSGINSSVTSITVASTSGFPASFPYTLIIDQDLVTEEIVTVTAASGTTLTVTRGVDGTSGVSHSASAPVNHGVSARDFDEPNAHVNDTSTDVHGQYVLKALVDAKGDLVTATADNTPARLAAGSNGQMLMADSGATAGLRYVDPPANRNLVINGAMQVAQRSTSVTGITGAGYNTADRWITGGASFGTWTQTVESDGPTGSGLGKSLKMLCTTAQASLAASARLAMSMSLEGQDLQRIRKGTSDAQQLTLSFWVKSNVTGTYISTLVDADNNRSVSASYSVSASATWERKTITFPADTTGAFDNDNARSTDLTFWLAAGTDRSSGTLNTSWASLTAANLAVGQTNLAAATNNYWQVTGVQLETGPVATPFEFEPFEATLRKCQRYYWRISGASFTRFATGFNISTTDITTVVCLPVSMRTSPTSIETTGTAANYTVYHGSGSTTACSVIPSMDPNGTSPSVVNIACEVASGLTGGGACQLMANNSTSAHISIIAEL
jgi:hypothetical protein